MEITSLVVPFIIAFTALFALVKKVDVFSAFTDGAKHGLEVAVKILPSLAALLSAVYMLRASGLMDFITGLAAPVTALLGIPPELAPLMMIRPVSGSGALAEASALMTRHGADSLVGRMAAVMMGSSETTFYTVSVYFGAVGIKDTRYAIPAALCADAAGFVAAAFFTRLFMGG